LHAGQLSLAGLGATEPFLGQVALYAGDFAPRNWAFANGQAMSIAQNTSLFALLGTTFGGNGQTTFELPDLRGRTIIGTGAGPGLTERFAGEAVGVESSVLSESHLPPHQHSYPGYDGDFDDDNVVDGADLLDWQRGLGTAAGALHSQGDANFDGDVDAFDLAVWSAQFGGPPPPSVAAVPEPDAALIALALCLAPAIASRPRRRESAPCCKRAFLGRSWHLSRAGLYSQSAKASPLR
jgi:hypothetical protein